MSTNFYKNILSYDEMKNMIEMNYRFTEQDKYCDDEIKKFLVTRVLENGIVVQCNVYANAYDVKICTMIHDMFLPFEKKLMEIKTIANSQSNQIETLKKMFA